MRKRAVSLIMCVAIFFTMAMHVFPTVDAQERSVYVLHNGAQISELVLEQYDKEALSVETNGFDVNAYQWQILLDPHTSTWVDIYDKTEQQCEISYAVVKNMLDEADSTYVRCAIITDNETVYSDEVCVSVVRMEQAASTAESFADAEYSQNEVVATDAEIVPRSFALSRETSQYVTITIKYLDASSLTGEEAAIYSPYVATIESGSSFNQNVISPTFLGFAPYYDANGDGVVDEDASDLSLDYPNVTENIEIKVYYKPIKVNFAIRYFFQNINDDLYTENVALYHTGKEETGTIISDEYLRTHAGNTTGFEKMYHIPESVAADGSTVFECYYDRNYYLIQFDLDGGYGVDPIYARYGTPFVVNDPVKHGYNFKGWDLITVDTDGDGIADSGNGIEDELPSVIPAEGQSYIALWETVETTYTVVYWKENADDNGYAYWGNAKKQATSASYVDGTDSAEIDGMSDAEYFTFNDVMSDKNILVEGDGSTIVNVYYTRNYYTLTFRATGVCTIPEGHTHSTTCYDYICEGGQHTHTDECLVCVIPEHTHGGSCCTLTEHTHDANCCDITYHVHGDDCCTTKEHTHGESCCTLEVCVEHTMNCWENVDQKYDGRPNNAPRNPQEGQVYQRNNYSTKYIYIADSWYRYSGSESSGEIVTPSCHTHDAGDCTCGNEEHIHGDGNCTCAETVHDHMGGDCNTDTCTNGGVEHTHDEGSCICPQTSHSHVDDCYNCGNIEHIHMDACLRLICSITEAHSHANNCNNGNRTNTVKTVYRKYQQSLEDLWPVTDDNGVTYDDGERWDPSDSSYYSEVLVYISTMPPDDFTLTLDDSSNSTKTMYYYLQVLPGEGYDVEYDGNQYKLHNTISANYGYITEDEDFFDIKGFVQYASSPAFSNGAIRNSDTAYFYYNRITDHVLQFDNNGILVDEKEEKGIMYGAPLEKYYFAPEYPANLEPNAYLFAGWYTSPGCYEGTEVNWETLTMPEGNLLLYAKWIPKTHTVNFFTTYDEMLVFEENSSSVDIYKTYDAVTHGTVVGSVTNPERPAVGDMNLIFAGWFYIENGQKKAFSPLDMPINRDMNIFADWSSTQPQPYQIQYVLQSDPTTKVTDDTTGFAYGGSTRTFIAKAGNPYNQLYDKFNTGYFPTVGSHSITMQYEEDKENPVLNTYTFYYVKANDIDYTVRYVNKENNTLLEEVTVKSTSDAVVTERFKAFENMVPDAFYKRLVISVEQDENGNWVGTEDNVITFYYTPNKTSAYYAVHFMLEKLDASDEDKNNYAIDGTGGYEETGTYLEGIGDVNSTVSIIPQTFAGFELIDNDEVAISVVNGEQTVTKYTGSQYNIRITIEGTELYIFYKRLEYGYTVNHYLYNTTMPVPDTDLSETGTAPYGSTLTKEAAVIPGYTCVSAQTTQSIPIRDNAAQNVITFYYSPVQYVAEYVAVPSDGGWLSNTIEVIAGGESLNGSKPTANPYYEFAGWYIDEACTISAGENCGAISADNKFTPHKASLSDTNRNIFYAKFSRKVGDLTIDRQDAEDDGQVFVYEVKNTALDEIIFVTVTGNSSVTIHDMPFGEYIITEQKEWSWRYTQELSSVVSHQNEKGTTVVFRGPISKKKWLNGNSILLKNIKGDE
ncbi:MAG: InlB B-repeat-containing protein [Eubacterium sp.]|nr:InlB B-repeat-containing protein [Eubacterium sp.]